MRPAVNPDARNPAANATPAGATSGASLLATFYIAQKEKVATDGLKDLLCRKLNLTLDRPGRWRAPDGKEAFLLRFDPRAAHDTTVLQVALNPSGDAAKGWEDSRRKLESILGPEALALDGIWGYTLTYQAKLNPGIGADEAFEKLRPLVHHLHPNRQASYKPLAQAHVEGGRVWLMAAPAEGEGPAAATVYVALSEPEEGSEPGKERELGKLFLGKGARLLMPELIAHKSYYQRRQYRGSNYEEYKGHLDEFRELVRGLLNELEQREVKPEELTNLTRRYHGLAEMVWQLEDLRVSMARQLHNYDEWEITGDNDILKYHRRYMETTNVELELLVSDGQYALGVADPVLSISRYRTEKAREEQQQRAREEEERRWRQQQEWQRQRKEDEDKWRQNEEKVEARNQQLIQTLLAVVAAALALPAIIDKDLAGWLIGRIPILESFEGNTFAEFVAQIVLIAILAVPIWLGVRRWLDKRREGNASEGAEKHSSEGESNRTLRP